jgi:alpha-beta hydrolase superfamily lysophospholipase
MKTKELYIINQRGFKLAANLDMPDDGVVKAYAVYAHCFTCSKELKAIANIDTSLADAGIATLRFDMTGIGESEGDFTETNFTSQLEDFSAVVEYLTQNYKAPSLYIGHSLGGTVALYSAMKHPEVKAVVTIASPCEPSNLARTLANTKQRAIDNGIGETEIGGVKFQFKPQFFEDIEGYNLEADFHKMNKPFLILHSPVDTYTDFENAEILFSRAKHPKGIISLDDIDHLMLKKEDAFYVGRLIAVWAEKYLW